MRSTNPTTAALLGFVPTQHAIGRAIRHAHLRGIAEGIAISLAALLFAFLIARSPVSDAEESAAMAAEIARLPKPLAPCWDTEVLPVAPTPENIDRLCVKPIRDRRAASVPAPPSTPTRKHNNE